MSMNIATDGIQNRKLQLAASLLLAAMLLYGANLYFDTNQNINDPVVPLFIPLVKDAIVFAIVVLYLTVNIDATYRLLKLPSLWLLTAFVASVAILTVWGYGISYVTLSLAKNTILYVLIVYIGSWVVISKIGQAAAAKGMALALSISFIGSVLMIFSRVQSLDGRLYGTYGNPTSLGFATIILFGLAFWQNRWIFIAAAVSALISVMSGSLSVIFSAAVLCLGYSGLERLNARAANAPLKALGVYIATFVVFGFGLRASGLPDFGFSRLGDAFVAPWNFFRSNSFTVRLSDMLTSKVSAEYYRYDGYLLTIWRNLGAIPLAIYVALLAWIGWTYLNSPRTSRDNCLFVLYLVLFAINPVIQHQLELFPTNALLAAVLAFCSIQFRESAYPGKTRG